MASITDSTTFEELSRDLRTARRDLLEQRLPQGGDQRLNYLLNELKVRELLASYCYARDALDGDWLGSLFLNGAEQGHALDGVSFSHSRFSNPVVRFDEGFQSGLVSTYFHTGSTDSDGKTRSRFGILLGQLAKEDGHWRFSACRNAVGSMVEFSSKPLATLWDAKLPEQPKAPHTHVEMSASRSEYYAVSEDGWGGARWLLANEPVAETRDEKLKLLTNNLKIRDAFSRYVNAYDSSNVDRVMDVVVAEDVLQLSRRDDAGTELAFMAGKDEVREQYRIWNASRRISFHRVGNVIARVLPGDEEAWACAYYNAPIVGHTNEFQSQFGGYFFRFVKEGSEWRLADRRPNGPNGGGMVVFPYVTPDLGTLGAWNGRSGT